MTKGGRGDREPAAQLPIARVSVDVPLAHLDRSFDYLVAAADDEAAQPGVRVKVRFAGQMVGGFLLERVDSTPHGGKLAYLDKIVSAERVLDPEVARLARAVADRYAGNLSDVLRLAVPPRHARVESQATPDPVVAGPAPAVAHLDPAVAQPDSAVAEPDLAVAAAAPGRAPDRSIAEAAPEGGADASLIIGPDVDEPAESGGRPTDGWGAYAAGAAYLRALQPRRGGRRACRRLLDGSRPLGQ